MVDEAWSQQGDRFLLPRYGRRLIATTAEQRSMCVYIEASEDETTKPISCT